MLNDVFRTATFRLAILFGLAVTASTFGVFVFIYWQFSVLDLKRINVILTDEMAHALAASEADLKRELDLRTTRDIHRIDYAALFDKTHKFISGNFNVLPAALLQYNQQSAARVMTIHLPDGETEPAVLIARKRPGGEIVVIGRRLYEVYALRQLVVRALVAGLIPASILALIIGFIFSVRSTRRLRAISQTIVRIMQGNLNERLPSDGRMDDINYVTSAVNLMLDEIVRLLDQIKSVGDNIAHDLRTPLAIVRAKLERALAKNDDKYLRNTGHQILSDIDRAITTVAALLRISEIESGRHRVNFDSVDLANVCRVVFEIYQPLAEANSISMRINVSEPVFVMGEFDLLVEAVSNLVDNAIKFTPSGKEVTLEARRINNVSTIQVADRGPGIAPEDRQNIFRRFYRSSQHRNYPGNGLGLNMAATIADLHGFMLRVEDNNPGALFILSKTESAEFPVQKSGDVTVKTTAERHVVSDAN